MTNIRYCVQPKALTNITVFSRKLRVKWNRQDRFFFPKPAEHSHKTEQLIRTSARKSAECRDEDSRSEGALKRGCVLVPQLWEQGEPKALHECALPQFYSHDDQISSQQWDEPTVRLYIQCSGFIRQHCTKHKLERSLFSEKRLIRSQGCLFLISRKSTHIIIIVRKWSLKVLMQFPVADQTQI